MKNKAQRLREAANDAQRQADVAAQAAASISERFEHGQPIILGHHTTKGARRDRSRADSATRQAIQRQNVADDLDDRASRAERIERLRAEIAASNFGPNDVEIGGVVVWGDLNTGTRLASHVTRVNRKSVSVDAGYTVPYERIIRVRERIA